jgi:hypothetical protein
MTGAIAVELFANTRKIILVTVKMICIQNVLSKYLLAILGSILGAIAILGSILERFYEQCCCFSQMITICTYNYSIDRAGDGICNPANNIEKCDFDGGDCCLPKVDWNYVYYFCGEGECIIDAMCQYRNGAGIGTG